MASCIRNENLHFPTIYRTFASRKDEKLNFIIQDLPEEYFDEAIELLVKHHIPEETFYVAKKLHLDKEASNMSIDFYREIFKKKLSIGCFLEGSTQLVAVNVMDIKSKYQIVHEVNRKLFEESNILM